MSMRRITVQARRPNPLFERWLEQMYLEAVDTPDESKYETALASLRKYPLSLVSGTECAILNGFGKSLCERIDRRLARHRGQRASESPPRGFVSKGSTKTRLSKRPSDDDTEYVPEPESCAYAVLTFLLAHGPSFTERDLAKELSQDQLLATLAPKTLRTELATLVRRKLVKRAEGELYLTEAGQGLARRIKHQSVHTYESVVAGMSKKDEVIWLDVSSDDDDLPDVRMAAVVPVESPSVLPVEERPSIPVECTVLRTFPPDSFDVVLLVDVGETPGAAKKPELAVKQLDKLNIAYELRKLNVGDFTWVARSRVTMEELILTHVVERKRFDDLEKSIKDGRFHEQKFRLKQCGVANVVYLIEQEGKGTRISLPVSTLTQAVINTRIHNGFNVHFTRSLVDSMKFLAMMTKHISEHVKDKTLQMIPKDQILPNMNPNNRSSSTLSFMSFEEFNSSSSKTKHQTVSDMFIRQLLQLKGLSVEKALNIVDSYPTPQTLVDALRDANSRADGEKLLCNLSKGNMKQNIGQSISKCIHMYFTTEKLS